MEFLKQFDKKCIHFDFSCIHFWYSKIICVPNPQVQYIAILPKRLAATLNNYLLPGMYFVNFNDETRQAALVTPVSY